LNNGGMATFIGERNGVVLEGRGAVLASDGLEIFEGHFVEGKMQGKGRRMEMGEGWIKVFEGEWVAGELDGVIREEKYLLD